MQDIPTQRALRALERAINDTTEALDNTITEVAAATGVTSVTAASSMVTCTPTTGAVLVNVVPANFGGIPQSGVTNLVTDLAAINTALAGKIDEVIAGTNLSGGGTSGSVTLDVIPNPSFAGNVTLGDAAGDSHTINGSADFNNAVNIDGALTLSTMTPGSVLFAGTGGLVSQDNANLNWNNTNKTLTVTSPSNLALALVSGAQDALSIKNTNAAGASSMYMTDNAGTIKVSFGYGNSSFPGGVLTNRAFIWRNGPDFIFQNQSGSIDAILFGNGNWNFGPTTTNPGIKLRVEGEQWITSAEVVGASAAATATLDVYRGSLGSGTARFRGTNHDSHFNFSTTEDTYLRGGKTASAVNIGDNNTGGVNLGATGNATTALGNFSVNGNATLGNAAGDSHTVNGTLTCANGVTLQSTLAVNGNATIGDAGTDSHTINGALDCNHTLNVDGNATFNANVTIGDASGDAHALKGTLNANSTAGVNGQVLAMVSDLPQWTSLSGISGVTGLGSNSRPAVWTSASNIGASSIMADTSTSGVSGNITIDGSTNSTPLYIDVSDATNGGGVTYGQLTISVRSGSTDDVTIGGFSSQGSFNCTAASRESRALEAENVCTRSAGSNALTNIGIKVRAEGAQVNIPIQVVAAGTAGVIKVGSLNARIKIGHQIFPSGGTYTPSTGTKAVRVRMVGGGGGGGGAAGGAGTLAAAGGGSSGVYWESWIDPAADIYGNSPGNGGTVTIGAAGSGGSAGANNGSDGGDTSVVIQGVTYTAKGGKGGQGCTASANNLFRTGGDQNAGSSAGDIVLGNDPGGYAMQIANSNACGGRGGSTPLGAGGRQTNDATANGAAGNGKGAGGGGAYTDTTSRAGGDGTAGVVIIEEFA